MVNIANARATVERALRDASQSLADDELVIIDDYTRELPYGWLFFYQAKRFVETGDPKYMVGGNAPYFVDRESGDLHMLGTAMRVEKYLETFERAWSAKTRGP
jgi:hypothetical protein